MLFSQNHDKAIIYFCLSMETFVLLSFYLIEQQQACVGCTEHSTKDLIYIISFNCYNNCATWGSLLLLFQVRKLTLQRGSFRAIKTFFFLCVSAVYRGTSHSLEQRFIDWMKGIGGSLHFGPRSYTLKRFQNQS